MSTSEEDTPLARIQYWEKNIRKLTPEEHTVVRFIFLWMAVNAEYTRGTRRRNDQSAFINYISPRISGENIACIFKSFQELQQKERRDIHNYWSGKPYTLKETSQSIAEALYVVRCTYFMAISSATAQMAR